ncbi:MFS transporter [Nonomuraea sp. LPB2021202275-12-8]|uniref:MFS transporter n=1 Tax=Nonomuraea sp. LPB2021202275-12-8 TaxID=3120159 RepID=UPI00300D5019
MDTQQAALSRGRTNFALATLFFGVFVLGCAELLVVGVLNLIAADLRVSAAAVGTLVTAYALGIAIGGPLLTALTLNLNKRAILIGTLILFAVANLIPVVVPDYGLFVAMRVVAGAVQGLFIAVGFVTGMSIVPPERAGRAISVIISGIAVSAALGVPLGTLVGQTLGWRGSFTGIIILSVVALVATLALVPSAPRTGGGVAGQARYAFAPRVLAVLVLNFLVFAAVYSALTYIVPFLDGVTGISGALISVFLLAYGMANAVGAFCGGRFADKNAARTLIVATVGTAACLLALRLVGAIALPVALVLSVWGLFVGVMVPSLQFRAVSLAGPGGALASSLPGSAVNVGIAVGSAAGGVTISNFNASAPLVTGLIIAVIAIPTAWATSFLKPPAVQEAAELTPEAT